MRAMALQWECEVHSIELFVRRQLLKTAKEIALEKLWNILIALLIGEVTTAFHYGEEKSGWLLIGFSAIVFVSLLIAIVSRKLDGGE